MIVKCVKKCVGCSLKVSSYSISKEPAPNCSVLPAASRGCIWSFIGLLGACCLGPNALSWQCLVGLAEVTAALHLDAVLNVAAGGF